MINKICVAIGKGSMQEALHEAEKAAELADVIEIRLDLIDNSAVEPFFSRIEKPLLFTNRASWEGGRFEGDEESRIAPLFEAIEAGAAYVDLELESPADTWGKLLIKDEELSTRVICSWHDFNTTPEEAVLEEKLQAMKASGADIAKIVTMAHNHSDVLRVLALQERAQKNNFPLIAFCMGEPGVISRVATCSLGGYMTYCSPGGADLTAPGQISAAAMRTIFLQMQR